MIAHAIALDMESVFFLEFALVMLGTWALIAQQQIALACMELVPSLGFALALLGGKVPNVTDHSALINALTKENAFFLVCANAERDGLVKIVPSHLIVQHSNASTFAAIMENVFLASVCATETGGELIAVFVFARKIAAIMDTVR